MPPPIAVAAKHRDPDEADLDDERLHEPQRERDRLPEAVARLSRARAVDARPVERDVVQAERRAAHDRDREPARRAPREEARAPPPAPPRLVLVTDIALRAGGGGAGGDSDRARRRQGRRRRRIGARAIVGERREVDRGDDGDLDEGGGGVGRYVRVVRASNPYILRHH